MYLFENLSKIKYPDGFNIQKIKIVKFKRGFLSLFIKVNYDNNTEFTEINFLKKKSEKTLLSLMKDKKSLLNEIRKQEQARGISEIKKTELMKLCEYMYATVTENVFQ